jgi:hypothetical protein
MTAQQYTAVDCQELHRWATAHGRPLPKTMPPIGFIVPGVAFIAVEVVGDRAWLELGLTNPVAPRSQRYAGLAACLHAAEAWAVEHEIRTLFAFTDRATIARWVVGKGYRPAPGVLTSKELRSA